MRILKYEKQPDYIYSLDDCRRIQQALLSIGISSSIEDCNDMWEQYSRSLEASWIILPDNDEIINILTEEE